jgi:sensor domain CHASE-containing protein
MNTVASIRTQMKFKLAIFNQLKAIELKLTKNTNIDIYYVSDLAISLFIFIL